LGFFDSWVIFPTIPWKATYIRQQSFGFFGNNADLNWEILINKTPSAD